MKVGRLVSQGLIFLYNPWYLIFQLVPPCERLFQRIRTTSYTILFHSLHQGWVSAEAACYTLSSLLQGRSTRILCIHIDEGEKLLYNAPVTTAFGAVAKSRSLSDDHQMCLKEFVQMLISHFKGRANVSPFHSLLQLYTPKSLISSHGLTRAWICDDTLSQGWRFQYSGGSARTYHQCCIGTKWYRPDSIVALQAAKDDQTTVSVYYQGWDPEADVGENVGLRSLSGLRTLSKHCVLQVRRYRGTIGRSTK